MAKFIIVNGKVFEEDSGRFVIADGVVVEDTTAAAGGQSIVPLIVNAHEQMEQANGGTL